MTPRKTPEPSRADIRAALLILARGATAANYFEATLLDSLKRQGYVEVGSTGLAGLLPPALNVIAPDGSLDEHARSWADARKARAEAEARMTEAERAWRSSPGDSLADWRRATIRQCDSAKRACMAASFNALWATLKYVSEHPDV
jgi:hypothetical protein